MVEMDVLPCKKGLHSLKIVWLVSTSAGRRQRRRVPRLHRRTPPYHRPHCSASVPHVPRGFAIPTATPSGSDQGNSTRGRVVNGQVKVGGFQCTLQQELLSLI